ncbi:beta-ketoacyl synthase N-terminal-like domain-containing protein [Streptococcus iniae]
MEDVIVGCSFPEAMQGINFARTIALRAGLPHSVAGQTVNRFCSSGLQTIATAANAIMAGQANCMVAGGVEFMSAVPMGGGEPTVNPTLQNKMSVRPIQWDLQLKTLLKNIILAVKIKIILVHKVIKRPILLKSMANLKRNCPR